MDARIEGPTPTRAPGAGGRSNEPRPLSAAERHQLLVEWSDTASAWPDEPRTGGWTGSATPSDGPLVPDLFAACVARHPEAAAVVAGAWQISYAELARGARRVAHRLRRLGVGPEARVGVCWPRSPELIVALAGVLEAGGAYVALDPAHPAARVRELLADAGAVAVIAHEAAPAELPGGRLPWLGPADLATELAGESLHLPRAPLAGSNLAYVIHTSGSTGAPKGVAVEHRALRNLAEWTRARYGVGPGDRMPLFAGLGFDAAVWELWTCLTAGATLLLPDEETRLSPARLVAWLAAQAATLCFLPTPLAAAALAESWPAAMPLRTVLTGGDRLLHSPPPGLPFRLFNHYGPTEATVVATAGLAPAGGAGAPPIGRPIANLRATAVDAAGEPVPIGDPGELCLAGSGLARGYLGRPAETADRFRPAPAAEPGGRLYRTGDLVRWRADGGLEFLGRADRQVKVRGIRIEPGEVEGVLAHHPAVRAAAVEVREEPAAGTRLEAYVVPAAAPADADLLAEELRADLARRLPAAMVPAAFLVLSALPLTGNGKLDRRALRPVGAATEPEPRPR